MPLVGNGGEDRSESRFQTGKVVGCEQPLQRAGQRQPTGWVRQQRIEQVLIQALANLVVWVAQSVGGASPVAVPPLDGEVAGLEQQRLNADVVHVEGGQQGFGADHAVQIDRAHLALDQHVDQELGGAGLEPVGAELAGVKQQQDVVRVVHALVAQPTVAVVPAAHFASVQPRQFRSKHPVQVGVRVAANVGVATVQGDVLKIVQAGEDVDLGELADSGEQGEPNVLVEILDGGVETAQVVTVGADRLRHSQGIQHRLVVLVNQNHDPLARLLAQQLDQFAEPFRGGGVAGRNAGRPLHSVQLGHQIAVQVSRLHEAAAPKAQPQHRVPLGPIPTVVNVQAPKQRLASLEQRLDGVEQQALAEPARAGQKVAAAVVQQPFNVRRLVHVVAALIAQRREGLDADGQALSWRCGSPPVHLPTMRLGGVVAQAHRQRRCVRVAAQLGAGGPGVVRCCASAHGGLTMSLRW